VCVCERVGTHTHCKIYLEVSNPYFLRFCLRTFRDGIFRIFLCAIAYRLLSNVTLRVVSLITSTEDRVSCGFATNTLDSCNVSFVDRFLPKVVHNGFCRWCDIHNRRGGRARLRYVRLHCAHSEHNMIVSARISFTDAKRVNYQFFLWWCLRRVTMPVVLTQRLGVAYARIEHNWMRSTPLVHLCSE
jgi:hypothetical protein